MNMLLHNSDNNHLKNELVLRTDPYSTELFQLFQ